MVLVLGRRLWKVILKFIQNWETEYLKQMTSDCTTDIRDTTRESTRIFLIWNREWYVQLKLWSCLINNIFKKWKKILEFPSFRQCQTYEIYLVPSLLATKLLYNINHKTIMFSRPLLHTSNRTWYVQYRDNRRLNNTRIRRL